MNKDDLQTLIDLDLCYNWKSRTGAGNTKSDLTTSLLIEAKADG